mmetsp:Transcript_12216/g.32857  ORF Transcript_12216/g.32857 Transcript_12216/m.32857 type:complete len:229 (+) Transcript_12216:3-689(+)
MFLGSALRLWQLLLRGHLCGCDGVHRQRLRDAHSSDYTKTPGQTLGADRKSKTKERRARSSRAQRCPVAVLCKVTQVCMLSEAKPITVLLDATGSTDLDDSAQVMTVGVVRPVSFGRSEISMASSARGLQTSNCELSRSPFGPSYFSRYRRIVAPEEPVPLRRKTIREPSVKMILMPWFEDTDSSTGSVYSKLSADFTVMPFISLAGNSLHVSTRPAIISSAPFSTPS